MDEDQRRAARRDYVFWLAPSMCIRCADCPHVPQRDGSARCELLRIEIDNVNRSRCPLHPHLLPHDRLPE